MVILLGGGGAGKTTIQNELVKRGYKRGILHTTRSKRASEINGRDYIFVNNSQFNNLKLINHFAATTKIGENQYGIDKSICDEDAIFVTNREMIEQLKRNLKCNIVSIYIKTTDKQREERLRIRGSSKEEIEEKITRNNIYQESEEKYADFIVENDELNIAVDKIEDIIENIEGKKEIIDAHSHIGIDYKYGTSKLDEYVEFCKKNGITKANVMPQPNPAYVINGKIVPCMTWQYKDGKITYETYDNTNKNPYKYINYYYYQQCKNVKEMNINFIPLIHPILDELQYVEELIKKIKPIAIKLHGIGSGIAPKDIPQEFIELLKKYNLPVITHVECDTRENTDYSEGKKYIKKVNNALDWTKFISNNGLRGMLTHGLALDKNAIKIIKNDKNIIIGLGPDLLISSQPYRINRKNYEGEYLELLKQNIPIEQLVFDVDYNWNINPHTNQIDNEAVKRVKKVWQDKKEQERIFCKNILEFYKNRNVEFKSDIKVCPELLGGLLIPREPCEIVGGTASDVIRGNAKILGLSGKNYTKQYMRGVKEVIHITKKNNVKMAVLKQKSPSCGYGKVYNGEFSGKIIEGNGILAEELLKMGIEIIPVE